jgi:hypothetical protein
MAPSMRRTNAYRPDPAVTAAGGPGPAAAAAAARDSEVVPPPGRRLRAAMRLRQPPLMRYALLVALAFAAMTVLLLAPAVSAGGRCPP